MVDPALKARFKASVRTEPQRLLRNESRFQRCWFGVPKSWGVAPGCFDGAPLAQGRQGGIAGLCPRRDGRAVPPHYLLGRKVGRHSGRPSRSNREQIDRDEGQQKIGHQGRRPRIILCHPLAEEKREN
jgi:hypothetical protein